MHDSNVNVHEQNRKNISFGQVTLRILYNTLFSREEIFAKNEFEIFSREDIFANILFRYFREYTVHAKISSREIIFPRIVSGPQICRLVCLAMWSIIP